MEDNRRYRVCVYCDRWQNGGAEAYLMNLFRFWDLSKLDCELVVSEVTTDLYDAELKALGIPRRVTLSQEYPMPVKRILHNLTAMRELFKSQHYDAVYLNLSNSFTMSYAVMAKRAGVPVRVVHSHCSNIQRGALRWLKMLGHLAGRLLFAGAATHKAACSQEAAIWLFGRQCADSGRIQMIHNGVDIRRFVADDVQRRAARHTLGLDDKWVIGTVGRLTELKNTDFLIRAFAILCARKPDAFLLLIGEGELKKRLEALIEELGLKDKVWLYGATGEVPRMLWAMDVFCLPSRFEGSPVSVIEAQAAGCYCLVSDSVTHQCRVCENLSFLPVEGGAEKWAHAMEHARRLCTPDEAAAQVERNGYSAAQTSAVIQAVLLEACREHYGKGGDNR